MDDFTLDSEDTEPSTALVVPVAPTADLVEAMETYQDLQRRLLSPNDWQTIQGKQFPKRAAWRKLAVAHGISFEIIDRNIHTNDEGDIVSADFVVRATAPNGRSVDGWGAASVAEKGNPSGKALGKLMHDIPATAETRAKNRACADLFGLGEVSAEEVDARAMLATDDELTELGTNLAGLDETQKQVIKHKWTEAGFAPLSSGRLHSEQVAAILAWVQPMVEVNQAPFTE